MGTRGIRDGFDLIDFEYPKIRAPAMETKQWIMM